MVSGIIKNCAITLSTRFRIDGKGRVMVYFTCLTGGMAERLGRGLQIRLQRFNSASHLQLRRALHGLFPQGCSKDS